MPESEEHRKLVSWLDFYAKENYKLQTVISDIQESVGMERPPKIGSPPHEPDLYGVDAKSHTFLVGEAKTAKDSKTARSERQIKSFLGFLESKTQGIFILALPGEAADSLRAKLTILSLELNLRNTKIYLYDTLDIWDLRFSDSRRFEWHFK
jgi:hypothetical protein